MTDLYGGTCSNQVAMTPETTMEGLLKVMRQGEEIMASYRRSRDLSFAIMRAEGYGIWSWDRGHGEEWVVDDHIFEVVKRHLAVEDDPVMKQPSLFNLPNTIGGVTLWTTSTAKSMGFIGGLTSDLSIIAEGAFRRDDLRKLAWSIPSPFG